MQYYTFAEVHANISRKEKSGGTLQSLEAE